MLQFTGIVLTLPMPACFSDLKNHQIMFIGSEYKIDYTILHVFPHLVTLVLEAVLKAFVLILKTCGEYLLNSTELINKI